MDWSTFFCSSVASKTSFGFVALRSSSAARFDSFADVGVLVAGAASTAGASSTVACRCLEDLYGGGVPPPSPSPVVVLVPREARDVGVRQRLRRRAYSMCLGAARERRAAAKVVARCASRASKKQVAGLRRRVGGAILCGESAASPSRVGASSRCARVATSRCDNSGALREGGCLRCV